MTYFPPLVVSRHAMAPLTATTGSVMVGYKASYDATTATITLGNGIGDVANAAGGWAYIQYPVFDNMIASFVATLVTDLTPRHGVPSEEER